MVVQASGGPNAFRAGTQRHPHSPPRKVMGVQASGEGGGGYLSKPVVAFELVDALGCFGCRSTLGAVSEGTVAALSPQPTQRGHAQQAETVWGWGRSPWVDWLTDINCLSKVTGLVLCSRLNPTIFASHIHTRDMSSRFIVPATCCSV